MRAGEPPSIRASPSSSAPTSPHSGSTRPSAPPPPASCLKASAAACLPASSRPPQDRSPLRGLPPIFSGNTLHPLPADVPTSARCRTNGVPPHLFRSSPPPPTTPTRPPRPAPDPTIPGARPRSGYPAPPNTRHRWSSPPPWPRCAIPALTTGPSCRPASSPTPCSPTPSSSPSCSPAPPMPATSPRATGSAKAGRPSTASATMRTMTTAPSFRQTPTSPFQFPSTSAAAGCWATAPE